MPFNVWPARLFTVALAWVGWTAGTRAAITGQWDFDNGTLAASIGAALEFRGDTEVVAQFGSTAALGIPAINGQSANVLRMPACLPTQGFLLRHGVQPNSGGEFVDRYTVVMDVLFPSESTGF